MYPNTKGWLFYGFFVFYKSITNQRTDTPNYGNAIAKSKKMDTTDNFIQNKKNPVFVLCDIAFEKIIAKSSKQVCMNNYAAMKMQFLFDVIFILWMLLGPSLEKTRAEAVAYL